MTVAAYRVTSAPQYIHAAHQMVGAEGGCGRLHGHTWKVTATFETTGLDERGFSVDFLKANAVLEEICRHYDHQNLNAFLGDFPTTEKMGMAILAYIHMQQMPVVSVTLEETGVGTVTLTKDNPNGNT